MRLLCAKAEDGCLDCRAPLPSWVFVGLNMDESVWHVTVYTKNRDRLLQADVAKSFFSLVVAEAKRLNLMSDEHFTVDGTLLEACASRKSFKKVDGGGEPPVDDPGNPTVDFHGESRSNQTHVSTTDADALLARKGSGKEAKLSYSGHHTAPPARGRGKEGVTALVHGQYSKIYVFR